MANGGTGNINKRINVIVRQIVDPKGERDVKKMRNDMIALSNIGKEQSKTASQQERVNKRVNKTYKDQNKNNDDFLKNRGRLVGGYLSVMFAGMALNRAMTGLVSTSLEWAGVTELMSLTLGDFFLPVALELLDILLPIMEWFMGAPDWVKELVGWIVLLAAGLGGIAMVAGQVGLALLGFKALNFGTTINSILGIGTAAKDATGKVSTLKSILGKTVAVAVGISIAWAGFNYINEGVKQGEMMEALTGILMTGIGFGIVGLTFAGVTGGIIGFTLGVSVGLLLSWYIAGSERDKTVRELAGPGYDFSEKGMAFTKGSSIVSTSGAYISEDIKSQFGNIDLSGYSLSNNENNTSRTNNNTLANVSYSPQYNITIADKREFEAMIERNNRQLTQDLRRRINA